MKTPSQVTLFKWTGQFDWNHLRVWLMFPRLQINEDFDYMTIEREVTRFELDLPTHIHWASEKDFWTVSVRVLGFGITVNRQYSY